MQIQKPTQKPTEADVDTFIFKAKDASIEHTSKEPQATEKLIQRSYYVTKKHIIAIGLKAAKSDIDKSQIVRDAIEKYCADEFNNQ